MADVPAAPESENLATVEVVADILAGHHQAQDHLPVSQPERAAEVVGGDQGAEELAAAGVAVTGSQHHAAGRAAQRRLSTTVLLRVEPDEGLVLVPLDLLLHLRHHRA